MANTINGVSLTQVAEETLFDIMAKVPIFGAICTDLSVNVAQGGSAVTTRIPTTGSLMILTGSTAQDQTTTAVTVTLGQPKGCNISITDYEFSTSTIGDLRRIFIAPSVNNIVKGINNDILALVTGSIHGNSYSGSVTNFGVDNMSDAVKDLVGFDAQAAVLSAALSNAVRKDLTATYTLGSNSNVIATGAVGQLFGMNVFETNGTFLDNIQGFACDKNALVLATRLPAVPTSFNGDVVTVQDKSGLGIQVRLWYSQDTFSWRLSTGLIWGVARGVPAALKTFIAA